jgi:hypothetical protein
MGWFAENKLEHFILDQKLWKGTLGQELAVWQLFCTELLLSVLTGVAHFLENVLQLVHSSKFDFKVRTLKLLERNLALQNITYLAWLDTRVVSPWKAFVAADRFLYYIPISLLQLYVLNVLESTLEALSHAVRKIFGVVLL